MLKKLFVLSFIFFLSACSQVDLPDDNLGKIGYKEDLKNIENQKNMENQKNQDQKALNQEDFEDLTEKIKSATVKTNFGEIELEFYSDDSPKTVNNFLNLAKIGFYDGVRFHRVMSDFMIQTGDPFSKDENAKEMWGRGGPGYKFDDEMNSHKLVKGSLAMANSGADTNGSQFFIVTADSTPWLDGAHTNFGYVSDGMDTVEKIEALPVNSLSQPQEDAIIEEIILNSK